MYPLVAKIEGRKVLVAGAGRVGTRKAKSLLSAGAEVTVVSPEASDDVRRLASEGRLVWKQRTVRRRDLRGVWLVFAATNFPAVNAKLFSLGNRMRRLVNSVDDPDHCTFYVPATVERGAMKIAITTSGRAPYLARRLKEHLDALFPEDFGSTVDDIGERRRAILRLAEGSEEARAAAVAGELDPLIDRALERLER